MNWEIVKCMCCTLQLLVFIVSLTYSRIAFEGTLNEELRCSGWPVNMSLEVCVNCY